MNFVKKTFFSALYSCSMQVLTAIKLSCIFGTKLAFFSLNQCLTPVMGFFAGTQQNIVIFCIRTLIALCWTGLGFCSFTYHLPTLAGTLFLTTNSRMLRVSLPLLSIILFMVHPVGAKSVLYCVYWLPPLIMSIKMPRSIFLQALASTLTTHAIGSTLWLYSHQTDPLFWHSLLSIVWLERVLFACCMTTAYYGVMYTRVRLNQLGSTSSAPWVTKRSVV